jgi:hypothetical protein
MHAAMEGEKGLISFFLNMPVGCPVCDIARNVNSKTNLCFIVTSNETRRSKIDQVRKRRKEGMLDRHGMDRYIVISYC